ncbi:hypothetical protein GCM10022238_46790 [Gordonia hankookensis]
MIVVLVAVVAHHDESADPPLGQQCLIDREVGQILLDRHPLVLIERDAGLHRVERRGRIAGVICERVWREAGW